MAYGKATMRSSMRCFISLFIVFATSVISIVIAGSKVQNERIPIEFTPYHHYVVNKRFSAGRFDRGNYTGW